MPKPIRSIATVVQIAPKPGGSDPRVFLVLPPSDPARRADTRGSVRAPDGSRQIIRAPRVPPLAAGTWNGGYGMRSMTAPLLGGRSGSTRRGRNRVGPPHRGATRRPPPGRSPAPLRRAGPPPRPERLVPRPRHHRLPGRRYRGG